MAARFFIVWNMTNTRTAIRQEAAARVGSLIYPYPCTAASGSTTTAVINEAIDSVDSEFRYVGSWVYFLNGTNAGLVRRIQSYAPTSGTVTLNRAVTSIATSDTFEIHEWFDPRIWHDCISRALRNTPKERRDEITIVTNQTEYSLATYTWFTHKDQFKRLVLREGTTAAQYRYREVPSYAWHVEVDEDVFTLVLNDPFSNQTSLAMFMDAMGVYADLATDAATTTCDLDWIVFGTLKQAYDVYGKIINDGSKRTILIDQDAVIRKHQQLTREFGPKWNPVMRLAAPGHT